jgi:MoaA/NifB/PqqE/SkfB family radical SAM enzyme
MTRAPSDRDEDLGAVGALLRGGPFAVRDVEAHEALAAVDLDLVTPAGALRVRIEANEPGRPAFARTASFAITHLAGRDEAPLPAPAVGALRAFARHLASKDPGGLALRRPAAPAGERARTRLPIAGGGPGRDAGAGVHAGAGEPFGGAGAVSEPPWSRALFDRAIAGLAREGGPFLSAVLVVVQPCEMSCRFCPSGDRARAVPPDLTAEDHYADLLHQLASARALGVETLEIGGNDVLRFPRAVDLFHAAGALGFRRISAQSPGQLLADEGFARAVAASPLSSVDLPIYGATADVHEGVTRAPGSFDELCCAVDRALALGRPEVVLHTIALRSTLGSLEDLLVFGRRRFGLDVHVELLRPNRVGEREHLDDAASLTEIAAAARRNAGCFGGDIPLCALPEDRARELHRERAASGAFGRRLHLWDLGLRPDADDAGAKRDRAVVVPPACEACALRGGCVGVRRAYVERFGDGELRPFSAP